MRKMFVFIGLLLLLLSGCHGSKESSSYALPETFDEGRNYEITFWAKNDTNINQVNVYKKAITDFEKIYQLSRSYCNLYDRQGYGSGT